MRWPTASSHSSFTPATHFIENYRDIEAFIETEQNAQGFPTANPIASDRKPATVSLFSSSVDPLIQTHQNTHLSVEDNNCQLPPPACLYRHQVAEQGEAVSHVPSASASLHLVADTGAEQCGVWVLQQWGTHRAWGPAGALQGHGTGLILSYTCINP